MWRFFCLLGALISLPVSGVRAEGPPITCTGDRFCVVPIEVTVAPNDPTSCTAKAPESVTVTRKAFESKWLIFVLSGGGPDSSFPEKNPEPIRFHPQGEDKKIKWDDRFDRPRWRHARMVFVNNKELASFGETGPDRFKYDFTVLNGKDKDGKDIVCTSPDPLIHNTN